MGVEAEACGIMEGSCADAHDAWKTSSSEGAQRACPVVEQPQCRRSSPRALFGLGMLCLVFSQTVRTGSALPTDGARRSGWLAHDPGILQRPTQVTRKLRLAESLVSSHRAALRAGSRQRTREVLEVRGGSSMSLTDTERNQRRAQQQGKLPGGGGGEEGELSRPVRYVMSCAIANALYFGLYWLLVPVVARSSVAVAGAYAVSVVWRHALHRRLVYGRGLRVDAGYVGELLQLYAAYSASLLLNPLIAEAVTLAASLLWSPAHPPHGARARARWLKGVGFGAAMAATAALNYLVVRRVLAPPAPHGPAPKPRPRP